MGYLRGTSNYLKIITIFNHIHVISMVDLVAIGVETLRIKNECSLEKEFTELIRMNPQMLTIPNYQSGLFMSRLCVWSFDSRHQRHLYGWMIVF